MKLNKVAVLLGGRSEEREISLLTGRAVANALKAKGVETDLIDWQGKSTINQLLSTDYDCAFIALHGVDGEDGCVQSLLEIIELPYTGSGVLANALCIDKVLTKQLLRANGLPVLDDIKIISNAMIEPEILERFQYPLCVKPVQQGSSIGIYKVTNQQELCEALVNAKNFGDDLMIEPWLSGGEYTVGLLNNKTLPSIRIEAKQEFYNYEAKYITGDTIYHTNSGLSEQQESYIQELAKKAFDVTGCYDWARVDFVTDNEGKFFILEINTVPGLTPTSLVPKAAGQKGINFDDMVLQITNNACLKRDNNLFINKESKAGGKGRELA